MSLNFIQGVLESAGINSELRSEPLKYAQPQSPGQLSSYYGNKVGSLEDIFREALLLHALRGHQPNNQLANLQGTQFGSPSEIAPKPRNFYHNAQLDDPYWHKYHQYVDDPEMPDWNTNLNEFFAQYGLPYGIGGGPNVNDYSEYPGKPPRGFFVRSQDMPSGDESPETGAPAHWWAHVMPTPWNWLKEELIHDMGNQKENQHGDTWDANSPYQYEIGLMDKLNGLTADKSEQWKPKREDVQGPLNWRDFNANPAQVDLHTDFSKLSPNEKRRVWQEIAKGLAVHTNPYFSVAGDDAPSDIPGIKPRSFSPDPAKQQFEVDFTQLHPELKGPGEAMEYYNSFFPETNGTNKKGRRIPWIEPLLAQDPARALDYMERTGHITWKDGIEALRKSPQHLSQYFSNIGSFPEGASKNDLLSDPFWAMSWLQKNLKKGGLEYSDIQGWPELEKAIEGKNIGPMGRHKAEKMGIGFGEPDPVFETNAQDNIYPAGKWANEKLVHTPGSPYLDDIWKPTEQPKSTSPAIPDHIRKMLRFDRENYLQGIKNDPAQGIAQYQKNEEADKFIQDALVSGNQLKKNFTPEKNYETTKLIKDNPSRDLVSKKLKNSSEITKSLLDHKSQSTLGSYGSRSKRDSFQGQIQGFNMSLNFIQGVLESAGINSELRSEPLKYAQPQSPGQLSSYYGNKVGSLEDIFREALLLHALRGHQPNNQLANLQGTQFGSPSEIAPKPRNFYHNAQLDDPYWHKYHQYVDDPEMPDWNTNLNEFFAQYGLPYGIGGGPNVNNFSEDPGKPPRGFFVRSQDMPSGDELPETGAPAHWWAHVMPTPWNWRKDEPSHAMENQHGDTWDANSPYRSEGGLMDRAEQWKPKREDVQGPLNWRNFNANPAQVDLHTDFSKLSPNEKRRVWQEIAKGLAVHTSPYFSVAGDDAPSDIPGIKPRSFSPDPAKQQFEVDFTQLHPELKGPGEAMEYYNSFFPETNGTNKKGRRIPWIEPLLAQDPARALDYMERTGHITWKDGIEALKKSPEHLYQYFNKIGNFPEGASKNDLISEPDQAIYWLKNQLKGGKNYHDFGRWPELEKTLESPDHWYWKNEFDKLKNTGVNHQENQSSSGEISNLTEQPKSPTPTIPDHIRKMLRFDRENYFQGIAQYQKNEEADKFVREILKKERITS